MIAAHFTPDISWGRMRPRKTSRVNRFLVLMGVGAVLAAGGIATARADGVLSSAESAYVAQYATAVCGTLDENPFPAAVFAIVEVIVNEDGFAPDDAVDIVNTSVQLGCPTHWAMLERIGEQARGETARTLA